MFNTLNVLSANQICWIHKCSQISILSTLVVLLYCTSQFSWRKTLSMKSCSFLTKESHDASSNWRPVQRLNVCVLRTSWRHLNQNQGTPSSLHGGKMPPPSRASSSTRFLRASHVSKWRKKRDTLLNKHETYWVFEGFFVSQLIYIYKMLRKAPVKVAKIMMFHHVWYGL